MSKTKFLLSSLCLSLLLTTVDSNAMERSASPTRGLTRQDSIQVSSEKLDIVPLIREAQYKISEVTGNLFKIRAKFTEGSRQYRAVDKLINDIFKATENMQAVCMLDNWEYAVEGGIRVRPEQEYKEQVNRVTNPGKDELGWYR
jgi:hypothetical protein